MTSLFQLNTIIFSLCTTCTKQNLYEEPKQLCYQTAAVVISGHGCITRELLTVIMLTKTTLRILTYVNVKYV